MPWVSGPRYVQRPEGTPEGKIHRDAESSMVGGHGVGRLRRSYRAQNLFVGLDPGQRQGAAPGWSLLALQATGLESPNPSGLLHSERDQGFHPPVKDRIKIRPPFLNFELPPSDFTIL